MPKLPFALAIVALVSLARAVDGPWGTSFARGAAGPQKQPQAAAERVRESVRALTADAFAGRATGSVGGDATIAWLVAECERLGLAAPPGLGRLQRFEVPNPAPAECLPGTGLWAPISDAADAPWRAFGPTAEDGAPRAVPFSLSASAVARGDLVFAGHGIRDGEHGLDDYADLDVRGKVVLVLRGGPPAWRERRGRAAVPHMRFVSKLRVAEAAGAVGFVMCNRTDARRDDPGRALLAHGQAELPAFWVGRDLVRAWFGGAEILDARQAALDREAEAEAEAEAAGGAGPGPLRGPVGFSVELRVRLEPRACALDAANVLAWIPGSDPERAHEVIVLGAHHDHLGAQGFGSLAEPGDRRDVHPGADDNASGVAGLLELARRIAANPLERPVLVAFFDAEELGQLGSGRLLEAGLLGGGRRAMVLVNLDTIGRARTQGLRVEGLGREGAGAKAGEAGADGAAAVLAAAVRAQPDPDGVLLRVAERVSAASDARAFVRRGVPALRLTSGSHDQIHRPSDVACLVQCDGIAATVEWAEGLVRALGAGPGL